MAFEGYVFERNEEALKNKKAIEDRPLLISYVVFLCGGILAALEIQVYIGVALVLIGIIMIFLARFGLFRQRKFKTGNLKSEIKIDEASVTIGGDTIPFENVESVRINLCSYEGQRIGDRYSWWKSDGRNNQLVINTKKKQVEMKFWVPSFPQYRTLKRMDFPENVQLKSVTDPDAIFKHE